MGPKPRDRLPWLPLAALCWAVPGCGSPGTLIIDPGAGGGIPGDSDSDGLCDATEIQAGTRSDLLDTDSDGFRDLEEVLFGYDPVDSEDPLASEVVYLAATPGATAEFSVRSTVNGDGEAHGGAFEGLPSLDAQDRTAADFFLQGQAISADPPENVRRIESDGERFQSVLGETRLTFQLRFRYNLAESVSCTEAFPFRYMVKSEAGRTLTIQYYLLVVGPADASHDPQRYCQPAVCF